ncbi:hypothetical protein JMUB7552_27600 [Staphylococcus aureus]
MSRGLGDVYKRQFKIGTLKLMSSPNSVSYTHLTLPTTPYV